MKQARKPRSYASRNYDPPTYSLTGVKCRATSVAKKLRNNSHQLLYDIMFSVIKSGNEIVNISQ